MLHNPKWDTKADPFSLESLIAWLEKQPADKSYVYAFGDRCLLWQYFTASGFKQVSVWPYGFEHFDGAFHKIRLSMDFEHIAFGNPRGGEDHTFGAALERARKLLAERS